MSVLMAVGPSATVTKHHLDTLDAQTLTVEEFEVIWCLDHASEDTAAYLTTVARHRPNVSVVTDGPAEAVARCRGDYVVVLTPADRLLPRGLETLAHVASAHDLDTVVGRTSVPGTPVPELLLADTLPVAAADVATLADGSGVLAVRRAQAEVDSGRLVPTGRCGVVSESVATRPRTDRAPAPPITCDDTTWAGGELRVECRSPTGSTAITAVAEHQPSGHQLLLPLSVDDGDVEDPTRIVVRLDPRLSPDVGRLEAGPWQLLLQTADAAGAQDIHPIAWRSCPPALLGDDIVVPLRLRGSLGIDVGPTTRALVLTDRPELGSVRESATGSRLQLSLPDVHTFDTSGLDGQIGFGDIRVPARLVPADPGLSLEAMATGIQGVVPITTRFGPTWFRASGLSLEIANDGAMRLVRTPPAPSAKKPTAKAQAPSKRTSTKGASKKGVSKKRARQGKVASLRRRVPGPLEPLVRAAARRPALRRLYRRLTR